MRKSAPPIAALLDVPDRFLRSVNLERDFADVSALDHYIVTPTMADAFGRIGDGLRHDSGRRAWRITGDYGVGKSSFALALAHLLTGRQNQATSRIAEAIGWSRPQPLRRPLWPVLLTGSKEGLVTAIARGIGAALRQRAPTRGGQKSLANAIAQARKVEGSSSSAALEDLLDVVRALAKREDSGVLLVIDELGKCLEYAAQFPEREDVFLLQRLAETAARSGTQPFIVLGLLHQGFHAYAERLPSVSRHEWNKVAGRFDEIVFDQPLAHTATLVAGALNLDTSRLPTSVRDSARVTAAATAKTGWLGGATTGAATLDVSALYPLHPTALPALVRFFGRFGQHERSLFGFLLSNEPFGLQQFAGRAVSPTTWFGLSDFYDYIRASFGHKLAGASYQTQWLRIVDSINSHSPQSDLETRVLKSVAVLNLLDADDLLPNDRAIRAICSPERAAVIDSAVEALLDRGLLFRRGSGAYRLWSQSSVNLQSALQLATRAVGPITTVAGNIQPFLDFEPILARRHYIKTGTLRYFELRYAPVSTLLSVLNSPCEADGQVVVALADNENDRTAAIEKARDASFRGRRDVVLAVTRPLSGLAPELQDVQRWQWVLENTPELAEDNDAAAEVKRQAVGARRTLILRLSALTGLRGGRTSDVLWFREGRKFDSQNDGGLSALVSRVCDELYPLAPQITNELLNRNTLSSAAAAARMRLIEALFESPDQPLLGIDPRKAPPEKSMYLSVIQKGRLHTQSNGVWCLKEPRPNNDTLQLLPAIEWIVQQVERARGNHVPVHRLLDGLREPPFGVRSGVAPLLLALVLRIRAHELAVYERGTFLHKFGPADFLRLTKAPATFELQHCRVEGVRLHVFNQLVAVFATDIKKKRDADLLDVVRPLCQFAAQLPEYTRRATHLTPQALKVRDALLTSREPVTLLFYDLPKAAGVAAFEPERKADSRHVRQFIENLQEALEELRAAYPELLQRIVRNVCEALGENQGQFDRAALSNRAARTAVGIREPRLRSFVQRLRDPGLSDEGWAEALGSFVVSKPPARWAAQDESKCQQDIVDLAGRFHRIESMVFLNESADDGSMAVRLNLTRGDGLDLVRVVSQSASDEQTSQAAETISRMLPAERHLRLDVLTRLLWRELETSGQSEEGPAAVQIER